jgi:uncharacterized membrane protein YhaH (DUF805 family)
MLGSAFSFRGRIGRLQYFMGVLATAAAFVLPIVAILGALGVRDAASAGPALALIVLLLVVGAPVAIWVGLSLQARRIRDIGLNPLYVIPILFAIGLADQLVALAVPGLSVAGLHRQTPVGLLVSLATGAALLFWPGKAGAAPPSPSAGLITPDEPPRAAAAEPVRGASAPIRAAPVRAAPARPAPVRVAPVRVANAAGVTFGRRGL